MFGSQFVPDLLPDSSGCASLCAQYYTKRKRQGCPVIEVSTNPDADLEDVGWDVLVAKYYALYQRAMWYYKLGDGKRTANDDVWLYSVLPEGDGGVDQHLPGAEEFAAACELWSDQYAGQPFAEFLAKQKGGKA